jgi:hypothetical protein
VASGSVPPATRGPNAKAARLGATHLEPLDRMSEVPARIGALEGPDLRHQVNSSDTPENELR